MADPLEKEIRWLESVIPGIMETRGFTLLGQADACEEFFLQSWIFPYQGWFGDSVLGGHLVRERSS